MHSQLLTRKRFLLGGYSAEYLLELPAPAYQELYFRFAWQVLHKVIPKQARRSELITDMQGLSLNNTLLGEYAAKLPRMENLLFYIEGTAEVEHEKSAEGENTMQDETSEKEEDFHLSVQTEFGQFLKRSRIQFKPKILSDGAAAADLMAAAPIYKSGAEINLLYAGAECFEGHFFHAIGFAPEVTGAFFIYGADQRITIKMRANRLKRVADFWSKFRESGERLCEVVLENFSFNLKSDFELKLNSQ